MLNSLKEYFKDKRILILGFGIEGQSTFRLLRKLFPDEILNVADINENLSENLILTNDRLKVNFQSGTNYLKNINDYDLIIKSPGIPLKNISQGDFSKFSSHTELFIKIFRRQIIGITGTKGKSTTASLIHHIIKTYNNNCILVGNIGIPPFDLIDEINNETKIVFELSSHQLEMIHYSPRIAVLLNLFEEHLDHYKTFEKYQNAKLNIALFQKRNDFFIFNADDPIINALISEKILKSKLLKFTLSHKDVKGCYISDNKIYYNGNYNKVVLNETEFNNLIGEHNLRNLLAAVSVLLVSGIPVEHIRTSVESFKPLEHRIEFVGKFKDILYYNDSISTIPEATIAAVTSLKNVDSLILGGFDRGISYNSLIKFLIKSNIRNLIFIGVAGNRMVKLYQSEEGNGKNIFWTSDFEEAVSYAIQHTQKDMICLLSPAAASYDMFKNFIERGNRFKKLVSE
ncbi:MAG TPA: UDP-N-acetylmuramoyl-L-alanine--D-glutamate ligase [Bacteroidales bacterium]|nr:UDP-N-acetylmuramoyl-L-alanine--D-glutamate ligase [Bacteroidales bacterium]